MENLYKWKFNKEIKKYSKKFLNSFNDREDIIQLVKEILNKEKLFIGYNKKIEFIEKIIVYFKVPMLLSNEEANFTQLKNPKVIL